MVEICNCEIILSGHLDIIITIIITIVNWKHAGLKAIINIVNWKHSLKIIITIVKWKDADLKVIQRKKLPAALRLAFHDCIRL